MPEKAKNLTRSRSREIYPLLGYDPFAIRLKIDPLLLTNNTGLPEKGLSLQSNLKIVNQCDLCGGVRFHGELSAQGWNLLRCEQCGLVFSSPRILESIGKEFYERNYYEKAKSYLAMQLEDPSDDEDRLVRELRRRLGASLGKQELRIMDIGCGAGRIVQAFRNNGWEAVGVDLNTKAAKRGLIRGVDLRTVPVGDPSLGLFDLITCFHVLEHVHQPSHFLRQIAGSLFENGFFLVEVPDYGSRIARGLGKNWPHLYPDAHLFQFTEGTAQRYLKQSGFSVLRLERVHGKGPLEVRSSGQVHPERWKDIKALLFAMRHILYWSPFLKRVTRHLFWHTLGFGECIRILARKGDCR